MKATVHLVAMGNLSENDKQLTKSRLDKKYPGVTSHFSRGDIIENVNESGYRSQGVWMWDGKNIIEQNTDWDDYGSPSKEFKIITEFPPGYWDRVYGEENGLTVKKWCRIDAESQFYWHSDYPPCALDAWELGLDKMPVIAKDDYYITFMHNGVEYKLNLDKPDIKKYIEDGIVCVYWHDGELHTSCMNSLFFVNLLRLSFAFS